MYDVFTPRKKIGSILWSARTFYIFTTYKILQSLLTLWIAQYFLELCYQMLYFSLVSCLNFFESFFSIFFKI